MTGMTEWYPMAHINPVRVGLYDYKCRGFRSRISWTGKKYKIDGFVRYACPDCRWRGFTKETYTALKKLSDRLPALPDEIDPRGELSRPERRPE